MHDRPPSGAAGSPGRRLSGLRVLVVGINYAPEVSGIGPYTYDACSTIAEAGASVTVVTGVPHYPSWTVDPAYARRLIHRSREAGVDVVRVRHTVPARQDALRRGLYEASWHAAALPVVMTTRADVVVGVTPALTGLSLARAAAGRRGVRWAAVVQDLLGAAATESGVAGGRRVSAPVVRWEAAQLAAADLVGVIGEGFAGAVSHLGVDRTRVRQVPNWSRVSAYPGSKADARAALGWPDDALLVVHTGNMGLKQDLVNVVRAAQECERRGVSARFALVGDGSQRAILEREAARVSSLTVLPPVSDDTYPAVLAASDVLLVNQRAGVETMSLPSKLTSYFVAARPVLAAVEPSGWTAQELAHVAGSVVVAPGAPGLLADEVERLASDEAYRQAQEKAARSHCRVLDRSSGPRHYVDLVAELAT